MKKLLLLIAIILPTLLFSQNVGIGTNTPQNKLHIHTETTGATTLGRFTTGTTTDTGGIVMGFANAGYNLYLDNTDGGGFQWWTTGTERMRLTGTGRLGIGINPDYELHVNGEIAVPSVIRLTNGGATTTFISEGWGIRLNGAGTHPVKIMNAPLTVGYDLPGNVNYGVGNVFIAGNVGIGTSNPLNKFHTIGKGLFEVNNVNNVMQGANFAGANQGQLEIYNGLSCQYLQSLGLIQSDCATLIQPNWNNWWANNNGGPAFISFHRGFQWGAHFGLDTDNWFSTQGWSPGSGTGFTNLKTGTIRSSGLAGGGNGVVMADNNGQLYKANPFSVLPQGTMVGLCVPNPNQSGNCGGLIKAPITGWGTGCPSGYSWQQIAARWNGANERWVYTCIKD